MRQYRINETKDAMRRAALYCPVTVALGSRSVSGCASDVIIHSTAVLLLDKFLS